MNSFLDWGIPIITAFQAIGDWLSPIMGMLTFIADELGYLAIMPFILWNIDYGLGLRFGTIVLASSAFNTMLKWTFSLPRPYWVDSRVQGLLNEPGFGFPSGHAQSATVGWGRVMLWLKRRWAYLAFGALILLISISRWYLGVHYPTDTLGAWIIGLLFLWVFIKLEQPFSRYLKLLSLPRQLLRVFALSILLIGICFGVLALTGSEAPPDSWETAAMANASDAEEVFDPYDPTSIITTAGSIFGIGVGAIFFFRWNQFSPTGPWRQRIMRYLIGLAGLVALYAGLKSVFPSGRDLTAMLFRYIRYALLGLWGTYLAPRLFVAVGLAKTSVSHNN